jgi:class 3 adenylate cyclase/predicted ATPase
VPEAERRQLTVLVCRLVGMPEHAAPLDPEALLEVVPNFHRLCAEVVRRYAGHLAQDQGDGLVVYFGYPQAHEDDARRAVYAGLEIVEAIQQCKARCVHNRELRFAVQVGIHTGLVVMSALGRGATREPLALGPPLTIAAQVQGLASADTVVISPTTLRLVEGYVVAQALGAYLLDDASEPLVVYQVLQKRAIQSRFAITAIKGLTPLVGREQEIGLLHERWAQARDGMGQVVVLSGEAGVGKSRLVQALTEHLAGDVYTRIECHCSPYAQQSALYPVVEQLQRGLQWRQEATPQEKLRTLEAALAPHGFALKDVVPLLAVLLTLPLPAYYPPLTLEPQRQKQKTLEALVAWWLKQAERQPVSLVVEDLHWVDPSTLELLSLLIDQVPTAPMLVLLLGRPEFHPPWPPRSYLLHLALNRLSRPQVETMVADLTGGKALPAEVHRQLVATTDGVPLFVEELTKMVLETGLVKEREGHYELPGPLPPVAIPATLHDSLMARLDRLGADKRVAQLGAVLGRQFAYGLLRAVAPWDEDTLQQAIGQFVDAELLYQRGYPPDATYLFKHALIQEAAYQSLLKSTRQQYHQRIAQVLAAQFPEITATQPELLARHYTEAGLPSEALPYWHQAGQRHLARSAYAEAFQHLTTGLEVLATVPETLARHQHELDLLIALTLTLEIAKGQATPELKPVLARAAVLAQQVGEPTQRFVVLRGLWGGHNQRAEHQAAHTVAEQLLDLAQRQHVPALLLGAHNALGTTLRNVGAFAPARTHLEQGIAIYDPQRHAIPHTIAGSTRDYGVSCRALVARVLWVLGYPDQAVQRSQEALTMAHVLVHPYSLADTLSESVKLHARRREWQTAQAYAEAWLALATEHGFARHAAQATCMRGEVLAAQGQVVEGIAQMHQGLAALQAMGAAFARVGFLAALAEAYGQVGQVDEGLHLVAETLAYVENTGGHDAKARLHRLHGELLLRQTVPEAPAAEVCFQQALDVARRQQAKSWELLAAMSLSRLWQRQGKHTEARALLAPIYGWFTEGFDTADLREAKALLEELA